MSLSPYALVLKIRHFLYDKGIIRSHCCDTPTICVGNITVGGTGKTPHTEMILRMLEGKVRTGVLSRGYKREKKGFAFVGAEATATQYGDEPVQIKRNFPETVVAVDKSRIHGIEMMENIQAKVRPEVIILDDAFQYRKLKPTMSIVLIDSNRPLDTDRLIPLGRLRDLPSRIKAADAVIITKCPPYMEKEDIGKWEQRTARTYGKDLFFTTIGYMQPRPIFSEADPRYAYSPRVLLFTGIANDKPLIQHLSERYTLVRRLVFPDHHKYRENDIRSIMAAAKEHPTALILTTEKDAQRIAALKNVPLELKKRLFQMPIQVDFTSAEQKETFMERLISVAKGNHNIIQ